MNEIIIRPATTADIKAGVPLIYMTKGRLADFLLGLDNPPKTESVLEKLFLRVKNRYSYQFADVAEIDGKIVGLLLSYSCKEMASLKFPMAKQLFSIYGLPGMFRFIRRSIQLMGVKEAEIDEYYINSLAVLPDFQGQGIGSRLLSWSESKARLLNLRKCSLTVEIGNEQAINLYEHHEYQIVKTVEFEHLNQRIGYRGFHRMVKELH